MEHSTLVFWIGITIGLAFYAVVIIAGIKRARLRELMRKEREYYRSVKPPVADGEKPSKDDGK